MTLDIDTLLIINATNVLLSAAILPVIMGRQLSLAASRARASLLVQALGWVAIFLSNIVPAAWADMLLSTVSIACIGAGQWIMFLALQAWLGPRRGAWLLRAAAIITPLGYAASFQNYPLRVGWSNLMLALQLLLVCQATLRPASRLGGPWRWVLFACTLTMAGFTAARGVMGAFFTELYPTFLTPHPVNVMAMLAANVSLVLGNLAVLVAWREEAEAQLHDQAYTDDMTGLPNRPCWNERALSLFDQARRHHTPLALIMLDLDRFKAINDNLGHDVGDQVLQRFGGLLRANRRSSDLVARIGGEEFALLLPQTDKEAALQFEQRLRAAVLEAALERPQLAVNYSAGLVMLQPGDDTLTRFMVRADNALYQAKHQGRGCLQALE